MAKVKAIKAFQGTAEEGFVHVGHEIEVSEARHRALAQNGLVPPPKNPTDPSQPDPREPGSVLTGERPPRRQRLMGAEPLES